MLCPRCNEVLHAESPLRDCGNLRMHVHEPTHRGGDGDAVDVLMIGESLPTGTVVSITPIATLLLSDNGELDTKLIAIPADSTEVVLGAYNYTDLAIKHAAAKKMIEDWFLNYKGPGEMELIGWRDEVYALAEIKKWQIEK